jgi:hypothetical protein
VPGSTSAPEPSEAARSALSALTAPTVPQPLPGSMLVDDDTYRLGGECIKAIARYLASDAPVPAGATVEQLGQSVVVDLPYARSGVFFEPGDGYCQYRIANAPTFRVQSTLAGVASSQGYSAVLCSEESETTELIVMSELAAGDSSAVLVVTAHGAGIVPGSMADVFASGREPPLPLTVAVVSPELEQFEFEVGGPDGTARVSGACTGSVYQFLGG